MHKWIRIPNFPEVNQISLVTTNVPLSVKRTPSSLNVTAVKGLNFLVPSRIWTAFTWKTYADDAPDTIVVGAWTEECGAVTGSRGGTFDATDWVGGCWLCNVLWAYAGGAAVWVTVTDPMTAEGHGWLILGSVDWRIARVAAADDAWVVLANMLAVVGCETKLFTLVLAVTVGRLWVDVDAAVTPSTGYAWLFTFTYSAWGRTKLSDVDGDTVETTAAPLVFEVTPLHCSAELSVGWVSGQERFGSAL